MQGLILALIVVVTTFRYLTMRGWLPGPAAYLPELMSGVVLIYVVVEGARRKFSHVRPFYWLVLGGIGIVMVCGAVSNQLEVGPMFAGIRTYFRVLPFFLLPAVFAFTEKHLRVQFFVLFCLSVIQVPLTIMQRMESLARGLTSGDTTTGTFIISSILSLFLICAISVVTALYLKKHISLKYYVFLFLILLLPTTINETKGTLLLLPVALAVTYGLLSERGVYFRNMSILVIFLSIFGTLFVQIYNMTELTVAGEQRNIIEFLTTEGEIEGALFKDAELGVSQDRKSPAGRLDSIIVPIKELAKDPATLVFGYGIGNASDSSLGESFIGRHFRLFEPFLLSSFPRLVLEIGLAGFFLLLLIYREIYKDSKYIALSGTGVKSALGAGWAGVTVVMGLSLVYKDAISHDSLAYLFWFYSGVIAAERMRIALFREKHTIASARRFQNGGEARA